MIRSVRMYLRRVKIFGRLYRKFRLRYNDQPVQSTEDFDNNMALARHKLFSMKSESEKYITTIDKNECTRCPEKEDNQG